jgi:hypothetical protein
MTEFEQQVAEVLTIVALEGGFPLPPKPTVQQVQQIVNNLAPRVAAAIEAACETASRLRQRIKGGLPATGPATPSERDAIATAALVALRGGA